MRTAKVEKYLIDCDKDLTLRITHMSPSEKMFDEYYILLQYLWNLCTLWVYAAHKHTQHNF